MLKRSPGEIEDKPFVLASDRFLLSHTSEKNLADFEITGKDSLAPPLRLLFVTSLPEDLPEESRFLELEKEQEGLIEALGNLVSEEKVLVEFLEIPSLEEIEKALSEGHHRSFKRRLYRSGKTVPEILGNR